MSNRVFFGMPLARRTFLSGAGAALLGTAFVPRLEVASASGGTCPSRFVVFWQPNGTPREYYVPTGSEASFTLGRIFASHESRSGSVTGQDHRDLKAELTLLTGQRFIVQGGEDPHSPAATCALTGRPMVGGDWRGEGISIDQRIADMVGADAPAGHRRSLNLSPGIAGQGEKKTISFRGAGQPVPIQNNPRSLFDELFGSVAPAGMPSARPRHVLEAVRAQACELRAQLGSEDRRRLDQHFTAIEELEAELSVDTGTCGAPDIETGLPAEQPVCSGAWSTGCCDESHGAHQCHRYERTAEQLARIAHLALSCDRTRVLAWSFGEAGQHFRWPWVHGRNTSNHGLGHRGDNGTSPGAKEQLAEVDLMVQQWHADFVARFVKRLRDTPEGDGRLLDHTVVLWQNELGVHYAGHLRDNPLVALYGGQALGLRGGRWLTAPGASQNDIHTGLLHVFGAGDATFGEPGWNNQPVNLI
ncbi:MAG: DUF1552 domain-containing protein [Myxococcota bacterium]